MSRKYYLIGILTILLFLINACERKEDIDDNQYIYKAAELDTPPSVNFDLQLIADNFKKYISPKDILSAYGEGINEFEIIFFITDKGTLQGIRIDKSDGKSNKEFISEKEERQYIHNLFLSESLRSFFFNLKFKPGIIDDKAVKSTFSIYASININQNGDVVEDWNVYLEKKNKINKLVDFNEEEFLIAAEVMPEPIGGINAIQSKIIYPDEAKIKKVEGKVYVRAFIDENGNVVGTQLMKGIGSGCDETAMKAIEQTKFKPASQNGTPVKVQVSIPIVFKLRN